MSILNNFANTYFSEIYYIDSEYNIYISGFLVKKKNIVYIDISIEFNSVDDANHTAENVIPEQFRPLSNFSLGVVKGEKADSTSDTVGTFEQPVITTDGNVTFTGVGAGYYCNLQASRDYTSTY